MGNQEAVTCACAEWEEIHDFQSPAEYARFVEWLDKQIEAGRVDESPVVRPYGRSELFEERWFRCRECGVMWRLVAPDPPFRGVFEHVEMSRRG
jgi:hypothetical protein